MSLGSDLTAARAEAGLTLQQVADATRIRRTVIERIEADDFSLCGGDVYARGHVRTISKVVGADPDAMVAEFERLHAPQGPTAAEVFETETRGPVERRSANWTAAMAAALVVVVAIVGFQVFRGGSAAPLAGNGSSSPAAVGPSSSAPSASQSTSTPVTPPPSTPSTVVSSGPAVAATGVTVILRVTDHVSWVSAKGSKGNTLFEGLVQPGTSKTFTDKTRVLLTIGRAGSVTLKVNGKDLGSPGSGAQVARLSFGPGDPSSG